MLSTAQPNGQYINFQGMVTAIKSTSAPAQTGGVKQEVTVWDGQESKDVTFWADPPKGKMPLTGQDINIEKSYSLRGKQDGPKTYWNLYLSSYPLEIIGIPAPQQGFHPQGDNPAHAAPINAAMAANNMQYQQPAQQAYQPPQAPPPPVQQAYSPPSQEITASNGRERNINLQSARKDAIAYLSASQTEVITEAKVFEVAERMADWAMGKAPVPDFLDQIPFGG